MAKATIAEIRKAILRELPKDGSNVGNQTMREVIAMRLGVKEVDEDDYFEARDTLVDAGKVVKGKGRGGSVARVLDEDAGFSLEAQVVPETAKQLKPQQTGLGLQANKKPGEPTKAARKGDVDAKIIAYQHDDKRKNNPDVGLVSPENDPEQPKTVWKYDPHLDPDLQFDTARAQAETLIDDALASGDAEAMRAALLQLKRMAAPHLNWAGKAERTSFEVDTVSLHVHERIDPATILSAIQKKIQRGKGEDSGTGDMFRAWFEEPLAHREALDFYRHERGWMNRLVAGDSLLVMNSLLQKENMAGRVQMIYIDPPYGIKYGSNFQPFVNKRDVKDRKDEDLTQEPEMIKAFRDTWELGIHSYLTYLRDRLLLARELLHESGSVFVQISDENLHLVRNLLDDIFGSKAFVSQISFQKTGGISGSLLGTTVDYLLWYAKSKDLVKYRQLFLERAAGETSLDRYNRIVDNSLACRGLKAKEIRGDVDLPAGRRYRVQSLFSDGAGKDDERDFNWQGITYDCPVTGHWKTTPSGLAILGRASRLEREGIKLRYRRFVDDFSVIPINDRWESIQIGTQLTYVVQTAEKVIERCVLMTTDPGDLVLDPTCGSGTTAYVAEKWGRRWMTCDTSRVAVTLAKQRLMTASYDYYELKYPHEGLRGGFIYKTVPHVTLKSIANNPEIDEIHAKLHPAIVSALADLNRALVAGRASAFKVTEGGRKGDTVDFAAPASRTVKLPAGDVVPVNALLEWEVPFDFPADWPQAARTAFDAFHAARQAMQKRMDASIAAHADQETLYDQPTVSKDKLRITGPFTVEAVPFPTVIALDDAQDGSENSPLEADASIARSGESARQHGWRDELLKTGIRGKGGQKLEFAELDTLPSGPEYRHLNCVGHLKTGERIVVCFGPEHAALEQRHVEMAMREAGELFPRPKMIVFCAFAFDPEAAKDIDATKGITALKAQMNTDLLTEDLKKNRASNQSFWLMGQPEVEVRTTKDGKYVVEVHGFDYFDTVKGTLVSGGKQKIAAWALDTDYDDRSLFPRQVLFPMAGAKDGWYKLKKDIKAELNEALLDKLHGTVSLPFDAGDNRRIAVKIVDDRGIESLKVMSLD